MKMDRFDDLPPTEPTENQIRIDALICGWSTLWQHSFTEQELDSLVDVLADEFDRQKPSDTITISLSELQKAYDKK
jgi:hypothetical protein